MQMVSLIRNFALFTVFCAFDFGHFGGTNAETIPLNLPGPCHEGHTYYEGPASYKCEKRQKILTNCVPKKEPGTVAIGIKNTLISGVFRSICAESAPGQVQYVRTHCIDPAEQGMKKFMDPGTKNEHKAFTVWCEFKPEIQTLIRRITLKKRPRICRHKKDKKIEENVAYQCFRNKYKPLYCIGKKQNGEDLRIELGEQKSDGLNYIYSCEAVYEAAAKKKSKRKPTPISAKYRRIKCIHKEEDNNMIDVEGETVLSDGRTVAKCETDKSGFRQKRFAEVPNKTPAGDSSCVHRGESYEPNQTFHLDGDILRCVNGTVQKEGCILNDGTTEMSLGEVTQTEEEGVFAFCEPNATGFQLTNQPKHCELDFTPQSKLRRPSIGYVDEQSPEQVRQCAPVVSGSDVTGQWNVTHCYFGTGLVKRGECIMVEKDYRRCSENETNHRPVFKKSTFDECRPSRTVFEVDSRGTIESETAIPVTPEEFENTSWIPIPVQSDDMPNLNMEYEDEYDNDEDYSDEDEEEEQDEESEDDPQAKGEDEDDKSPEEDEENPPSKKVVEPKEKKNTKPKNSTTTAVSEEEEEYAGNDDEDSTETSGDETIGNKTSEEQVDEKGNKGQQDEEMLESSEEYAETTTPEAEVTTLEAETTTPSNETTPTTTAYEQAHEQDEEKQFDFPETATISTQQSDGDTASNRSKLTGEEFDESSEEEEGEDAETTTPSAKETSFQGTSPPVETTTTTAERTRKENTEQPAELIPETSTPIASSSHVTSLGQSGDRDIFEEIEEEDHEKNTVQPSTTISPAKTPTEIAQVDDQPEDEEQPVTARTPFSIGTTTIPNWNDFLSTTTAELPTEETMSAEEEIPGEESEEELYGTTKSEENATSKEEKAEAEEPPSKSEEELYGTTESEENATSKEDAEAEEPPSMPSPTSKEEYPFETTPANVSADHLIKGTSTERPVENDNPVEEPKNHHFYETTEPSPSQIEEWPEEEEDADTLPESKTLATPPSQTEEPPMEADMPPESTIPSNSSEQSEEIDEKSHEGSTPGPLDGFSTIHPTEETKTEDTGDIDERGEEYEDEEEGAEDDGHHKNEPREEYEDEEEGAEDDGHHKNEPGEEEAVEYETDEHQKIPEHEREEEDEAEYKSGEDTIPDYSIEEDKDEDDEKKKGILHSSEEYSTTDDEEEEEEQSPEQQPSMEEEEEEESTPEDYSGIGKDEDESTETTEEEGRGSTEQASHAGDESDEIITEITSSSEEEEEENEEWEKEKTRALLAGESIELKIVDIITIITEISDDDNGKDLEQPSSGDKVQQLRHQNIDELMELEDTGRRPETSEEIENIETSYDDDDYDEEEGEPQSIEDQLAGHPQNIDELMEFEDTGRRPETSKETEDIDLTYDMPDMHEDVEGGEGNIEHIPPAKYDEEGPPFEEHVFEEDDPNAPAEYFDQDQTSTPKHPPKGVQPSPPQYISPKFPSEPSIRVVQPLPEYILNQFKKPEVESPAEAEEPHIPSYIQHPTQEDEHQVEPTELLYVHHHPKLEEQPLEDDVNEKPYPLFPRPPAGVQEDEPAIVTESDLPDPVVTLPTLLEMPEYDEEYDETGPEEHERRPFSFLRPPSVEDDMLEYLPELPTPNIQKQPIAPEYHRDEPEKHVERKPFPIVEADMPEPTEAPVIERDMPESDTKKPMEEYDETEPEKAEKPSSPLLRPPIVEHDMPESVVGTSPTPIIDMPMAAESREMEPEKPERPSFFEPFPFVQDYYMPEPTIEMPPSEYHHLEPEIHDRRIFPFLRPPIVEDDMPEPSEAPVIERDMPVSDDTSTKKPTAEYHEMEPPGRPTLLEPLPFEQDYMPEPTIEMPPSEYHHLEPEIPEFDATEEPSFLPGPPAERRPPKMGEFGELPPSRLMRISEDPKLAYKPAGKMFEDEFTSTEETQRGRPREESEEEQVEDEEEVDGKMPTDISKQQLILEDNQKGRPIDRIQPMEPMQFFTGKPAYQIPSRIMLEQHKPFLIGPKEEEDRIPRILETSSEEEEEDEESTPSIPLAPAPPQLGVQLETPKILESTSEEEEEEEEIPAEEEMTSYYPNNNKVEREKAPPPRPAPPNFERPTPRSVMEGMPPPPWLVRKWPNLQYQRIRSIPPPSLFYHEIGHEEEWENDDDDEKERRGSSAEEETDEKYGEKTGRLQTFIPFKRESEKTEFEPLPSSSEEEEDDCEEDYYDEDDDDQSEESEEYLDEPTTTPNEKYVIEARLLAILGLLQLQMRPATVWESDHLLPSSLPPQRPRNPYARTTTPVRQPWKDDGFLTPQGLRRVPARLPPVPTTNSLGGHSLFQKAPIMPMKLQPDRFYRHHPPCRDRYSQGFCAAFKHVVCKRHRGSPHQNGFADSSAADQNPCARTCGLCRTW